LLDWLRRTPEFQVGDKVAGSRLLGSHPGKIYPRNPHREVMSQMVVEVQIEDFKGMPQT
jgi:hypothetical protein